MHPLCLHASRFISVPDVASAEKCIKRLHGVHKGRYCLRVELSAEKGNKSGVSRSPSVSSLKPSISGYASQGSPAVNKGVSNDVSIVDSQGRSVAIPQSRPVGRGAGFYTNKSVTPGSSGGSSTPISLGASPFRSCGRCGKLGKHRCSRCKITYCSPECQLEDWPSHKLACMVVPPAATSTPQSAVNHFSSSSPSQCGDAAPVKATQRRDMELSASPATGKPSPLAISADVSRSTSLHLRHPTPALYQNPLRTSPVSDKSISPVPGFSMARLRGPQVVTPSLISLPGGFQCVQLPEGSSDVQLTCIRDDCADIYLHIRNVDQSDRLALLNSKINALYQHSDYSNFRPAVGDVCVARYNYDGLFYRVRVEQEEENNFEVTFLDYGNSASVPVGDLRQLRQEFGVLPFQAVRCCLSGIVPACGTPSWSSTARELLLQTGNLVANLVHRATSPQDAHVIELCDRSADMAVVNDLLVARTVATRTATLAPGQIYKVSVVDMVDTGCFFLALRDDYAMRVFNDLCTKLQQHCMNSDPLSSLKVNDVCCARFHGDGKFYRAKVKQINPDHLTVHFFDFGSVVDVPSDSVRRMKAEFMSLPGQAIAACLHNIKPAKPGVWTDAGKQHFASLTDSNILSCECVASLSPGDVASLGEKPIVEVNLFHEVNGVQHDIGAALVEAGHGQFNTPPLAQSVGSSGVDLASKHHTNTSAHSKFSDGKAPDSPAKGYPAERTECKVASSLETPSKSSSGSSILHGISPTSLSKPSKVSYRLSHLIQCCLPDDVSFQALVSEVSDPSSIWIQPYAEDSQKFIDLNDQLSKHCTGVHIPLSFSPAAGDVCCALFEGDGQYYRVLIEEVLSNKRYRVTYIDFGSSATINASLIYPAIPAILELRVQAIKCQLAVTLPSSLQAWPENVQSLLSTCVNVTFEAVRPVTEVPGLPAIDLEDTKSGRSVCQSIRKLLSQIAENTKSSSNAAAQVISVPAVSSTSPSATTETKANAPSQPSQSSQSSQSPKLGTSRSSGSSSAMISSGLECVHLPVNQAINCVLSDVKTPNDFWLTNFDCLDALRNLLEEMSDYQELPGTYVPRPGDICAAQYSEDLNWYRARVNCVLGDVIEVTFVDFGNSETSTTSVLRPLLQEHRKLPCQAIHCSLARCHPVFSADWSPEAIRVFKELAQDVEVVCTSHGESQRGLCSVSIQVSGKDVASELVTLGLAVSDEPAAKHSPSPIKASSRLAKLSPSLVKANSGSPSPVAASGGPPPPSLALTSPTISRPSTRLSPCGQSAPSSAVSTTPASPAVMTRDDAQWSSLPHCDGDIDVIVADVDSPACFHVQYADSDAIKSLNSLINLMNDAYSGMTSSDRTSSQCMTSLCCQHAVCAAQFSQDGGWYRATVLECSDESDQVKVRFTDFGNTDLVSKSSLRPLQADMLQLPMQAIECTLADVKPVDSTWSKKANEVFCSHLGEVGSSRVMVQHSSQAQAISTSSQRSSAYPIRVTSTLEGRSINDILVAENYAVLASPTQPSAPLYTLGDLSAVRPSAEDGYFEGLVSDAESPCHFHLQVAKAIVAGQLQELGISLTSYCKSSPPVCVADLAVDQLCIALFSADRCWYRVVVCEIFDKSALVRFVDYGNTERVSEANLRHFDNQFLSLPRQALMCKLHNLQSSQADGKWSPAAGKLMEKFSQAALCVRLYGEESGVLDVDLYDTSGDVDVVIGDEFVKAGLGANLPSSTQTTNVKTSKAVHTFTLEDLPAVEVSAADGFFDANISDVESPGLFHLQLAKTEVGVSIQELGNSMASSCKYASPVKVCELCIGQLCIAQFSADQWWYRAVVCQIFDKSALVRFVDYGNTERVSEANLRHFDSQFLSLPRQALMCKLHNLQSSQADGKWSPAAGKLMEKFAQSTLCVRLYGEESGVLDVDLYDTSGDVDVVIGDEVVKAGLGTNLPSSTQTTNIKASKAVHMFTLEDLPAVEVSAADEYFDANISDVESPGLFHLQLAKTDVGVSIQELGNSMASSCKNASPVKVCELCIGQLCIAQFSADQWWYRAVVCQIFDKSALVRFVDYGNTERVSEANLRHFDSQFLSLPRQALMCKLHNLQSSQADGKWSPAAGKLMEKFSQAALCVRLYGEESGVLDVDLYDTSGDVDVVIGDEVVKAGHGTHSLSSISNSHANVDRLVETSSIPHRSTFPICHLPRQTSFDVVVTHIRNPSSFSVQRGGEDDLIAAALMTDLGAALENIAPTDDYCPILGEVCCALFAEEQRWYRAVVDSVSADHRSVDITFVDYGNIELNVSVKDIRPLPEQFLELPMQAVSCSLHGVTPAPAGTSEWAQGSIDFMNELMPLSSKLTARILAVTEDSVCLEVWDM